MSMKPYFSVVIPLYNKEDQIRSTLGSVLEQSFQDFEVIIVNDGSTDSSVDIVSSFDDQRIRIINKKNEGASIARNFGVQNSNGEYLALLDADDIWFSHHLADLKHLIENFIGCGLYCSAYETSYYSKNIVKGQFFGINHPFEGIVPDYFTNSLIDSIACSSSIAIPKTIFEKYGYFDSDIKSGQDTEFWIRIALKEKIAFTSKISARIIIGNHGNHLSLSANRIEKLKILEKFRKPEESNKSLKKYMDVIRFALAIDRKMSNDSQNFRQIVKNIDFTNLNFKQKIILNLPGFLIRSLKKFQGFLINKGIYLTPFR